MTGIVAAVEEKKVGEEEEEEEALFRCCRPSAALLPLESPHPPPSLDSILLTVSRKAASLMPLTTVSPIARRKVGGFAFPSAGLERDMGFFPPARLLALAAEGGRGVVLRALERGEEIELREEEGEEEESGVSWVEPPPHPNGLRSKKVPVANIHLAFWNAR